MSSEDEVRTASAQFYAALNSMMVGDAAPLAEVWSHGADVSTMHPIGGREAGWDEVRGSFEQVAQLASGGHGELRDQSIQVGGDLAYEVGIEQGQITLAGEQIAIEHRVTNVYRREAGGWKIVHHHTDLSPAMLNLLSRLQAAKATSRAGKVAAPAAAGRRRPPHVTAWSRSRGITGRPARRVAACWDRGESRLAASETRCRGFR